ncbi:phage replisome organizer N-terminal domain-containing protein [Cytobacillus horneckiae]|uniref:phage replisome organizer N-terminal domain-containing protein n=1 Tax=Cytobacillus horneckiae TaxID=549687 RepID=UPI00203B286C|nr:phage replisome organizer N-terminal domain-containing protein [Cytobacillus horneckiae]MCM3180215.1 phage replisome organizer N-terminal domain-containing protein [Cytobacillus horneckiae]
MADVKWIKLSTQMFEDEKIRLIESMPEADTLLIIWIKLLSQAGKTNASGYIYLNENIPYTEEMLATIFNRPISVIRLALKTFESFGMIEITGDHFICINNWEKHQNLDGLEKIREQNRLRKQRERERKKLLGVTGHVTEGHATDIEKDKDKELEEDKEKIPYVEIVNYLNNAASSNYRSTTKKTKDLIKARYNEGFTEEDFKRVIDIKTAEWIKDEKMNKFLRPETLFGTKFESYLNQKGGKASGTDPNASKIADEYDFGF